MRRAPKPAVHPMDCRCRTCVPVQRAARAAPAIRAATRALVLVAALIAVPFIVAHALACARAGRG
ncbi:hypothetical protein [Novosphingobium mathurense]|uniref:Uncharacterized protein n=1 Tax=Novosphingobium mathurense TaxID=428990 RepID=A0A1U6IEZ7_9SPHN|nr:hypothetical protein [Novosphingobium mathurense]SLK06570.1 hypothetical protein SAMN06295987_10610 [Novosphingobium mathurense]